MEAAIGIIGLSLQLIDSAMRVKRVISTYRSASSEINRLALKVERVEAICGAIMKNFEGSDAGRRCSGLMESWGVCVLRDIQSTLVELHGIVTKLERRASKKRALHTSLRVTEVDNNRISLLPLCMSQIFAAFYPARTCNSVLEKISVDPSLAKVK
ncbi:hypothetical protein CCHR01_08643 [Colletotrichum chrysophilum]|uniref:Fungal N-terminal domain-containing protein n=1 Tax=Colletotrichum chrysophilum TaxID=1836956 RepID=A0AAD9AI30_9PEZI|nr:hypothetical protein CCHR01_08643 [Colletotrichum chrysophilum]